VTMSGVVWGCEGGVCDVFFLSGNVDVTERCGKMADLVVRFCRGLAQDLCSDGYKKEILF
jgi:hypothetical protein